MLQVELYLEAELDLAKSVAKEAGAIALERFENPTGIKEKPDGTVVSDVDKEISAFIAERIQGNRELVDRLGNFGYLDEEREDDGSRFVAQYCWVIDPLDNSAGYLRKGDDWSIIMGLMRNFNPVMGVIYRPVTDELACAIVGEGAFVEQHGSRSALSVDNTEEIRLIVSRARNDPALEAMIQKLHPVELIRMGGMVKCVEVAKGAVTDYVCPPSNGLHLWDVCAPQVIVQEADGEFTTLSGADIDYSYPDTIARGGLLASNGVKHHGKLDLLHS